MCLVVTRHPHFWHNDRDLLRANAVTRGWNGYRNKSQHRKLTLEKKILPPLLRGLEPGTFRSGIRRSNHQKMTDTGGCSRMNRQIMAAVQDRQILKVQV